MPADEATSTYGTPVLLSTASSLQGARAGLPFTIRVFLTTEMRGRSHSDLPDGAAMTDAIEALSGQCCGPLGADRVRFVLVPG